MILSPQKHKRELQERNLQPPQVIRNIPGWFTIFGDCFPQVTLIHPGFEEKVQWNYTNKQKQLHEAGAILFTFLRFSHAKGSPRWLFLAHCKMLNFVFFRFSTWDILWKFPWITYTVESRYIKPPKDKEITRVWDIQVKL